MEGALSDAKAAELLPESIGELGGAAKSDSAVDELWNDATKADNVLDEGAGDNLKFKSWNDFSGYIQDIGKDIGLTTEEKVSKIQKAYQGIEDKTDINIPIDAKYVKGFTMDGEIDYDWPKYLGFDKTTIKPISRSNLLPENWNRYGSMNG